jgi:hypothetical protein
MAGDYRMVVVSVIPGNPEARRPTFTVLDRDVAEAKERS